MTIIQPSKSKLGFYTVIAILMILLSGGYYIYEYNYLVALRHQIESLEKELITLQNLDSDFKNQLYSLIDSRYLENLAKNRNLLIEKNPKWVSAF